MTELEKLFAQKKTENGDDAYSTTGNSLVGFLFMSAYYEKHLKEARIGTSQKEKLFAMFIRDPRHGLGRRDLGRELMRLAEVKPCEVVKAGRCDDLIANPTEANLEHLLIMALTGDALAKKWLPRLNSGKKAKQVSRTLCKVWGISQRKYRKLCKCDTTESRMSQGREIEFKSVPSLAIVKYFTSFHRRYPETFSDYIKAVKEGKAKINVGCTNVYDIYKNRKQIDPDLFFDKIEKISLSCVPIVDTSLSMKDGNDSLGKAISIGHYLSMCSRYAPKELIIFSQEPELVGLEGDSYKEQFEAFETINSKNTDFAKVMDLFKDLSEPPEYLVVLSDMEFDVGSSMSKTRTMELFKEKGYKTKIVWWNFNTRNTTVPELDEYGNIFLSGYSPQLLQYMQAGFDGAGFIDKLLEVYQQKLVANE